MDKKFKVAKQTTQKVDAKSQQDTKDKDFQALPKPVALLIGNNDYAAPNELKTPTIDVLILRQQLLEKGYTVILSQNVTSKEIKDDIDKFVSKSKKAPISFFYYAGHTLQINDKNYLVPIDAKLLTKDAIITETVDLEWIIQKLDSTKVNILSIDGCYPFSLPFNSFEKNTEYCFATPINLPKWTAVTFTTAQDVITSRKNSSFITAFSKELKKEPKRDNIYNTFINTKKSMKTSSGGKEDIMVFGYLSSKMSWGGLSMMSNKIFPNFPWPLPRPSGQVAPQRFEKAFENCKTLAEVNSLLATTLQKYGYHDMRYYGISRNNQNRGFALVTRLEQINKDATSKEDPNRWNDGLVNEIDNNNDVFVMRLVKSIFLPSKGYFRVFAFLVTDLSVRDYGAEVSRNEAMGWFDGTNNELPPNIAKKKAENFKIRAYIYEFELLQNKTEATLLLRNHRHTGIEDVLISGLGTELIKD